MLSPEKFMCMVAFALTPLLTSSPASGEVRPTVYPDLSDTTEPPSVFPLMNLEYQEPGLVVLALGQVTEQPNKEIKPLIDLQFGVARATAPFGPVLLLVPDADSRAVVWDECGRYQVCTLLAEQKIRVVIVPHEGPWVRDYGPSFGIADDGSPVVIHARYHAHDDHLDKRNERARINRTREEILRHQLEGIRVSASAKMRRQFLESLTTRAMQVHEKPGTKGAVMDDGADGDDGVAAKPGADAAPPATADREPDKGDGEVNLAAFMGRMNEAVRAAQRETEDAILAKLRDLADVYSDEASFLGSVDDESHYALAEAVLQNRTFALYRPPIAMDGGNMLEFQDGECVTTTELIKENGGIERVLHAALVKYYGCRKVIYLTPLPGRVIKHVDMFLLPVNGKRVLMASYDPALPQVAAHWGELESWQKALVFEAAVVMKKNAAELQRNGYTVIPVPSLPPAKAMIEGKEMIYYPTVLNALVRTNREGHHQVLMPSYKDQGKDIQDWDADLVRREFGAGTEIVQLEATRVAQGQGAIHCLTLMVPEKLSVFADRGEMEIREAMVKRLTGLEKELTQRNHYVLEGLWHGSAASAAAESDDEELSEAPLSYFVDFKASDLQIWTNAGSKLKLSYKVDPRSSTKWLVSGYQQGDDGRAASFEGKIIWKDASHLELRLATFPRLELAKQEGGRSPEAKVPGSR